MSATTGQAPRLRRYPVVGYAAAAVALAVVLPSGLTIPTSGPPTTAEQAPVPGQGNGSGQQGDLGQPGGNGLGAGGGGLGTGSAPAPGALGTPPPNTALPPDNNLFCVKQDDGLYHQTGDPLSPLCISRGPADNGGPSGAPGVTADEVRVVVDLQPTTATGRAKQQWVDCAKPVDPSVDSIDDMECKAYWKFFNTHFQTYHRDVHLYGVHGVSAGDTIERFHPFADVNALGAVYSDFAAKGVLAVGFGGNDRRSYAENAPYELSFWPDFEDEAALAASYVCRRMGPGSTADLTVDPALAGRRRTYGYWADSSPLSTYDKDLIGALRAQCGIDVSHDEVYGAAHPEFAAKLKQDGVTTVVAAFQFGTGATVTGFASDAAYFPEWVVPGSDKFQSILSNSHAHEENQTEWQQAVGIGFDYRRDGEHTQWWYRAYREACPSCSEPSASDGSYAPELYDTLQLLFTGIQLGGPRLTAQTIDRGLHAIPPTSSPSPYRPAAYLVPGNWSYLKDAVGVWWDPKGQTPDASAPGCYRLVEAGRRYRTAAWPAGDGTVKGAGPCQGDTIPGT